MFTLLPLLLALQVTATATLDPRHRGKHDKFTGCSAEGYKLGGDSTLLFAAEGATGEAEKTNPEGWCMVDSKLTDFCTGKIAEALTTLTVTPYANGTQLAKHCETTGVKDKHCIKRISEDYISIVGSNLNHCNYPRHDFIPTNCNCGFECKRGHKKCGEQCIPRRRACKSGRPEHPRRDVCAFGLTSCELDSGGYECIDIMSNLDSCGGCPGAPGAVDCAAIPGVEVVNCIRGKCVVASCGSGYSVVEGGCELSSSM